MTVLHCIRYCRIADNNSFNAGSKIVQMQPHINISTHILQWQHLFNKNKAIKKGGHSFIHWCTAFHQEPAAAKEAQTHAPSTTVLTAYEVFGFSFKEKGCAFFFTRLYLCFCFSKKVSQISVWRVWLFYCCLWLYWGHLTKITIGYRLDIQPIVWQTWQWKKGRYMDHLCQLVRATRKRNQGQ